MLLDWAKKNLETLNLETAKQYLLKELISNCLKTGNHKFQDIGVF
jgi:hypothetical protein